MKFSISSSLRSMRKNAGLSVGCKLSKYDAYQKYLGSIADYYYG